ncbi:hypothetical protein PR202_gb20399 [Eleusine coracana subsp. coracana]|uniref:Fatty acyl-CoA reductase n=1 Tax=Eleusine coracana subsp. coracana TaxID=191504 RepID=A0AAV5FAA4_ELECO|nr:hypothetical protein PR202_gb20399 [Eleusine coracana subsp. coracana]
MAARTVAGFFLEKSILITGSTGFLGKLLVEKILRVQPDVKKLYLLVRAPDAASAKKRVLSEVYISGVLQLTMMYNEIQSYE